MLFEDLPELTTTPVDESLIMVGSEGEIYQTGNLFEEVNDAEMVRLVLSKVTPNQQLNNHIADPSLHKPIADTTVSVNSTWSSERINTAIIGSNPWFNLDAIPEGATNRYYTEERAREVVAATTQGIPILDHRAIATQIVSVDRKSGSAGMPRSTLFPYTTLFRSATNRYYTEERAREVVAATTQGIPILDHRAIATQIVSVLLGFNSNTFRYHRANISDSTPVISVSVDGGTSTANFFDVIPGVRNIQLTPANALGETWICDELVHSVVISSNGSRQVTPKLTLDSFVDGTVNKLWNTVSYANSPLVQSINNHLTGATFRDVHARINDASNGANDTTWSSNKIINFVSSEIARNRTAIGANAKAVIIGHEVAASGQNATGYTWDTATVGSTHTHHISRVPTSSAYNSGSGGSISSNLVIPPGTWMVYWEADMTLRSGLFASVTGQTSYIALATTPRTPVLTAPGVITVTGSSSVNYRLVSRFNTTTPYNASFQSTWLQPQSVAGVGELYATVHIERVR